MDRLLTFRRTSLLILWATMLLVADVASAQHQLPGLAPRVRAARGPQPARRDPAPEIGPPMYGPRQLPPAYAQRPPVQQGQRPGMRPMPPAMHPTPQAAPRQPERAPVEPAAYQAGPRTAMNESQIFFDDPPAGGEELPAPGGAPYEGPYDTMAPGDQYFSPEMHGGPYQYEGPAPSDIGYGDCVGGWGVHMHGDFHVGPFHDAFQNLSIFGGAQGFESPVDLGVNGNFGFHEGLNYGGCVTSIADIGYQIGGQVVHSNLSGFTTGGDFSEDARHQYFVTAGLFRRYRAPVGFQWGVVYDYLHDDYDINMDVGQLRGEIAFRGWHCNEIGFMFTANVTQDQQPILDDDGVTTLFIEEWTTTDQYALFWRRQLCSGALVRLWAGGTGDADGLLGGEFEVPITCSFAVSGIVNYKIPEEGASVEGTQNEAWGLGLNLVWYPCGTARNNGCNKFRPLFNVADNATMLLDRESLDDSTNGNNN